MPSLERSYPNKRVLITGATSGPGRTLALEFARRGWKIAVPLPSERTAPRPARKKRVRFGTP